MMNVLAAIGWVAGALYVFFKTTAVYEYLKLLPLPEQITKMKEYEAERRHNFTMSYKEFFTTNYDTFLIRLLTCPYCLSAWLSLIFCGIFSCFAWLPVVYLGGLITYLGTSLVLDYLQKKENENG